MNISDEITNIENIEFLTLGIKEISKLYWSNPTNNYMNKPCGGLWTSPYTPDEEYKSEWHDFTSNEMTSKDANYGVVFKVKPGSNIYIINTYNDLFELYNKYPKKNKDDYFEGMFKLLDFESMAKDYDGVFLTNEGQWETRFTTPLTLYGWDVESMVILNFDCIGDSEYIEW